MGATVALYVRSSKDRADVSCESQVVELTAAAHARGETIHRVYEDRALSSTRDELPGFTALLEAARQDPPPFTKIYALDTSRLARDTYHAQSVKYWLRKKRGIELCFLRLPSSGTYMDVAFEKTMEIWDELHSNVSKEKAIMGQKQNIRRGYRAGGKAPYGYRLRYDVVATHRDGKEIRKAVNEPDPVTGPLIAEYFERRARGESRASITRDFEARGVPSPSGDARWSQSTGRAFEENLDTYLGHLVYNRHQEHLRGGGYAGGRKFRPRGAWVVHPDAHPPLTTAAIAAVVRSRLEERSRRPGTTETRTFCLLTGILRCGSCGGGYEGDRALYRCGTPGCRNGRIAKATIERIVAAVIEEDFLTPERLRLIVRRDRLRQQQRIERTKSRLSTLERDLAVVERKLATLWDRHADGTLSLDQYRHLNAPLWQRREALVAQLAEASAPLEVDFSHDQERVARLIKDVTAWLTSGKEADRRYIVGRLFTEIRLGPRFGRGRRWERNLDFVSDITGLSGAHVASPAGFEPAFRP